MIIGFSGKLGTGKSFYTKYTVDYLRSLGHQVMELAFGDQIKINVLAQGSHNEFLSRYSVYDKKDDYSRNLLQIEGTEKGRAFDKNIWVKYIDEWMYLWRQRGVSHFVISDIRFPNELEYVESCDNSYVFQIKAPKRNLARLTSEYSPDVVEKFRNHPSEISLDSACFQYTLFNDTVDKEYSTNYTDHNKLVICNTINSLLEKEQKL